MSGVPYADDVPAAPLPPAGPDAVPDASGAVLLPEEGVAPGAGGLAYDDLGEGADLARLARERGEYLDALQHLKAEFENYRKRVERQQRDIVDNAATALVKKLLPVLDTADLALAHGGGEDIKQLAGTLFDVLAKEGLERLVPEGQPFDPELHDAVAHEPAQGDDASGRLEVTEVLRAGYSWKGRVLRPAMVKVRG
ncbi:MAG TPA: nucleotide exchange factor GrpE [Acidimicrobiales bacterium]|nr:nucleotide exchange factor GrpE [Acidimicrobiales bacterium]